MLFSVIMVRMNNVILMRVRRIRRTLYMQKHAAEHYGISADIRRPPTASAPPKASLLGIANMTICRWDIIYPILAVQSPVNL